MATHLSICVVSKRTSSTVNKNDDDILEFENVASLSCKKTFKHSSSTRIWDMKCVSIDDRQYIACALGNRSITFVVNTTVIPTTNTNITNNDTNTTTIEGVELVETVKEDKEVDLTDGDIVNNSSSILNDANVDFKNMVFTPNETLAPDGDEDGTKEEEEDEKRQVNNITTNEELEDQNDTNNVDTEIEIDSYGNEIITKKDDITLNHGTTTVLSKGIENISIPALHETHNNHSNNLIDIEKNDIEHESRRTIKRKSIKRTKSQKMKDNQLTPPDGTPFVTKLSSTSTPDSLSFVKNPVDESIISSTNTDVKRKKSSTKKKLKKKSKSVTTKVTEQDQINLSEDSDDQDFAITHDPVSETKDPSTNMTKQMRYEINDLDVLLNDSDEDEDNPITSKNDNKYDHDKDTETKTETLESDSSFNTNNNTVQQTSLKPKISSQINNGITISVVTWNLAETAPDPNDFAFMRHMVKKPIGSPTSGKRGTMKPQSPDVVLVGGQECENTKPRRTEGHRSCLFRSLTIKNLGKDYVPLAIHSLGGVQCLLFCHRRIHPYIDLVNVVDVACGVGNVFHNKGAIGVYLQMRPKGSSTAVKMLFVAAHLAAHVKNVQARNEDFWRILSELEMKSPPRFLPPKEKLLVVDRRQNGGSRGDLSSGAQHPK